MDMKQINTKDLVIYILTGVVVLGGGFMLWNNEDTANTDVSNVQEEVATTTASPTVTKAPTKTTTAPAPKVIPSKNVTSRCNFEVTSPAMYSSVSMPFVVKGVLDKANTSTGCMWNENASRAGDAEIFYNRRGEGWRSAGAAVPIMTTSAPNVATTTLAFSVSFNLYTQALGLTSGTPIKIVFTELNIPPQLNPDIFEFQVTLK